MHLVTMWMKCWSGVRYAEHSEITDLMFTGGLQLALLFLDALIAMRVAGGLYGYSLLISARSKIP